jgi:hypothetical protein
VSLDRWEAGEGPRAESFVEMWRYTLPDRVIVNIDVILLESEDSPVR